LTVIDMANLRTRIIALVDPLLQALAGPDAWATTLATLADRAS
jgi:hypothetical protein